jgi:hypothetical protein
MAGRNGLYPDQKAARTERMQKDKAGLPSIGLGIYPQDSSDAYAAGSFSTVRHKGGYLSTPLRLSRGTDSSQTGWER